MLWKLDSSVGSYDRTGNRIPTDSPNAWVTEGNGRTLTAAGPCLGARGRLSILLKELVLEPDGRALTPWFTRKRNGRLYRYGAGRGRRMSLTRIHKTAETHRRAPPPSA